jgi:hypothetical protein
MKWKTVARVARLAAYAVVPGAAGYAAYRYVIRPWLDRRGERKEQPGGVPAHEPQAPKPLPPETPKEN